MPVICFVTLSRSDYASMRPVALSAAADSGIDMRLIAGGSHCLERYGHTLAQIRADGLDVRAVADFLNETDDTPGQLAHAYARAVSEFVRIFSEQQPDAVFLIGDRWEMLAVATAATMLQLPLVHHSGGDITQGSADNQTRYALSTLAHLHMVALPEHLDRLLHLGEEPWRVSVTGEPALTMLQDYAAAVPDIHARLGLAAGEPFTLATFHPTSFESIAPTGQVDTFLEALDSVEGAIVLTAPNPDAASEIFLQKYRAYAAAHPRVQVHESLGSQGYYAAMAAARYMIGNSSSGLWESASFRLPVVNIGPRQNGRVHGDNVIHAPLETGAIRRAIAQATDPAFRAGLDGTNPYVRPDTIPLILQGLRTLGDRRALLAKKFIDPLGLR